MQSKRVTPEGMPRIWVLVLSPGEEAKKTILNFAKDHDLKAASFVALGAFENAQLGYFDWQAKKYLAHRRRRAGGSHHPGWRYRGK